MVGVVVVGVANRPPRPLDHDGAHEDDSSPGHTPGTGNGAVGATSTTAPRVSPGPADVLPQILGAMAMGAAVGFILDRRSRRRAAAAAPVVVQYARKVSPAAGEVLETAIERVSEAVEVARPIVEQAYEAARPRVEQAYAAARPRVEHAYEVARPKVESGLRAARAKAEDAVDAARPRVERAVGAARDRLADADDNVRQVVVNLT
jgi:vacuolar-type H+-ATPase subunit H